MSTQTQTPTTPTKEEFWRWHEYHHIMPNIKPTNKDIITAGVDVGSVGSKAAVMVNGQAYSWGITRTGSNSPESAKKALNFALKDTNLKLTDLNYVVGTGYGRVNVPMANKAITEIACHAKGANYIWGPSVRTVLDVGGQDIKAIKIDATGRVVSFLMNDKCAAGTGRGMEVFADLLQIPIEDIGPMSLKIEQEPEPVSCTCVAFAKTEAIGLLRKGWSKEKVLAAYTRAMAVRMANLINRVGLEPDLVVTGGQSKNVGIVSRIETILGLKCLPTPNWREGALDPMAAGAFGAALLAKALYEKEQKT
ncbi:acyl-CoA dehydratase activase [Candidatus Bathycorpusculum sp.]|jgi:bzd-type benzoyl-CoA reductase Q subunit|uniref:acyl-CoA dehydratase activase n=1 Tax=Candidatus Bathycorpusculum sp. TaxID=2994959 RepID=UPI002822E14C|nr:acyl-CoA dehydratase activase [Candidatus Termitimicrobium sp.]MCL2686807.1 acyl-CoA dehydratase activase [Candidatus Termitimicrobium sp.]